MQFCGSHSLAVALMAGHECSFTRSQDCASTVRACDSEDASGNCKRVRHLRSALCELQAALGLVVCAGRGTASRRLRLRSCSRLPPALLQLLQADILPDQASPVVPLTLGASASVVLGGLCLVEAAGSVLAAGSHQSRHWRRHRITRILANWAALPATHFLSDSSE